MQIFLDRGKDETEPDQWQTQIFLRVLSKASVIFVSDADEQIVRGLHLTPAKDIGKALELAKKTLNKDHPTITAIPDGVAVTVVE